jgi:preprotein translocase, secY subunit
VLQALGNIFQIPELRQKIVFTLIMFAVFRMGTHIPVPGVDPTAIEQLFAQGTLFGLLDLFSGGAFSKFSVFAMSITPYINAAIIIQLLNVVVPTLEQWSKEGAEGQKKTTKVTRYLTVALAFFQAIGMSIGLKTAILNPNPVNILIIAITLTAGTVFLMWLGEQITANGVGNGISLIIFAGIVAALPKNIGTIYAYVKAGTISYFSVFAFAVIALAMIVFVIHIETGFRRVPITYAKRVVGGRMASGHSSHIPFKVNQAGVIPIIFASSVLMFPITVAQFIDIPWVKTVAAYLEWGKPLQTTLYVFMIIFFTYFYTSVTVKIPDMADNLKKYGGFVPGLRPGQATADYLDYVLTRITLAGAFFLAFIAVLPNLVASATNIQGVYFGGTALLIVVGVALQTMKQIESMVVMRHYEGFMK